MSRCELLGVEDIRRQPMITDSFSVLKSRGLRADRLDALAIVRSQRDAEITKELRRITLDLDDDEIVRAAAIKILADRGEEVTIESQPSLIIQMAQKKAQEILFAHRLVSSYELGSPTQPLPATNLLAMPSTGLTIETATPNSSMQAQVTAASSLRPVSGSPGAILQVLLIQCGPNEFAIVADPERLVPSALLRKTARPAQVAVHHKLERDFWTTPFEILTEPAGNEIKISILDSRGRTRYAGRGRLADPHRIEFMLQTSDAPGATPIVINGHIEDGNIIITLGRVGKKGGPAPRRPLRVSGPL